MLARCFVDWPVSGKTLGKYDSSLNSKYIHSLGGEGRCSLHAFIKKLRF